MKRYDVFVGGHLALDVYPGLQDFASGTFLEHFKPGKLLYVENVSFCTGGPVSNTGLILHKLGMNVCLMGKIGHDAFGEVVKQTFDEFSPTLSASLQDGSKYNSTYRIAYSKDEGTSYTINISPPGIDRIFLHYRGANDTFIAADVDYDFVKQSQIFHFGYPPLMRKMYEDNGENLSAIMRQAKKCNVITSLDMALPDPNSSAGKADWEAILKKTLPYVDIFAPSFEEIVYMADRDLYWDLMSHSEDGDILRQAQISHLETISDRLLEWGAKIILIKIGERGLFLRTPERSLIETLGASANLTMEGWENQHIWSPCFKANFVGAAGSGDATIAGFLSAMIKNFSIDESVEMAVAVGACCVEALDTLSGVQEWDKIRRRIESGWEKHELKLLDAHWRMDPKYQHWRYIH